MIVGLAIALALLIQGWIVKPYQIPSQSMEPTLDVGQRVLVNRVLFHLRSPQVGDIVVFHPPKGAESGNECGVRRKPGEACPEPTPEEDCRPSHFLVVIPSRNCTNFIKRVVAVPGDRLSIKNGHPVVNGKIAQENFIRPCGGAGACNLPKQITIPPDHYFMMGDNRGASDDSRYWGPVPRAWIIGKAFLTYWPPDRIGTL